jgi:hypothetical protein
MLQNTKSLVLPIHQVPVPVPLTGMLTTIKPLHFRQGNCSDNSKFGVTLKTCCHS